METSMQFLLRKIENGDFLNHPKVIGEYIKHHLLEKEKKQIIAAYVEASPRLEDIIKEAAEQYYNETFNTK